MNSCAFDVDEVCRNKNFENNYEHRCIEADNVLKNEQTLCRYRIVKPNKCYYAKVENGQEICTNADNDDDYGETCVEIYCLSPSVCKYHDEGPFSKCRNKNQDCEKCIQCDGSPLLRCFEPEIEEKPDNVNHPNHHCQGGIECIKAIEASMTPEEFQGYCKGNVMKYVWRFREKNGLEDLKKAQVYLGWMIESKEKQEQQNQ